MDLLTSNLFESSTLLNALFKTAIDGIIVIDEQGIIHLNNPALAKLFSYSSKELLGQNISILMAEPEHSAHDEYLQHYIKTNKKRIIGIGREVEGLRKNGTVFPIRLSVSEIHLNGHRFFTGIIHDLSEQHEIERQIKQLNADLEERVQQRTNEINTTLEKLQLANQQLKLEIRERKKVETLLRETERDIRIALEKEKELSELKARFVTMASHEFRTPLSTILSSTALVEMYKEKEQEQQKLKHLQRIRSSVNNLTNILNDFLSLSKLEEGKIVPKPEWFSMSTFCAEVMDEMMGLLKPGQKIQHQKVVFKDQVFLDKHLLKNILFNLVSNAIKYSPVNATIYCEEIITDKGITFSIQDEGIGIPKADQAYLFTRFFRAQNVTNIGGTGLGLNIVKRYVELMQGSIAFESEIEKGSTFKITLPIKA